MGSNFKKFSPRQICFMSRKLVMCQLLLMPRHQKDDHHLSTLLAVLADAFMENDFCHLSNYSVFIPRAGRHLSWGQQSKSVRLIDSSGKEGGYLFVFSGTFPAPRSTRKKQPSICLFRSLVGLGEQKVEKGNISQNLRI